ncbi:MAG: glycosyltransferase family 2 protein [Lachnotalea sp.]
MKYKYKFSLVIAIYNMENYLVETIDSVVNQTIGFEDNLQILLVNDGSNDNSEEICKSYTSKYPENIVYIKQENGGVSEARNKGLEYATGELVNFLDADDKLQNDALEKVYAFFEQNREEVDLIAIPLYFFEGKEGEHVLNYKFTSTRVIDIFNEPKSFQMHISSSFIKIQEIKKYAFNSKLKLGEDAEVANKVIFNKGKYGVVADTKYWYRQRSVGNSAIQGAKANKMYYIAPLKYLHLELIEFAKKKYSKVPTYLQWLLIYDLGWKIRVPYVDEAILNQSEIEEFIGYVKQVVTNIEDEIILGSMYLSGYSKKYLFTLKYKDIQVDDYTLISNKEEAVLCLNNQEIAMLSKQTIQIEQVKISGDRINIKGSFNSLFDRYNLKLIIDNAGIETQLSYKVNESNRVTSLNQFVSEGYEFHADVKLENVNTILKAQFILNNTKADIEFIIKLDHAVTEVNPSEFVVDNYKIICKNKSLTIKKADGIESEEEVSKKITKVAHSKELETICKLYKKNTKVPGILEKFVSGKDKAILKSMMEAICDNDILQMSDKEIPFNYRYYLLKQMKYNGDYKLNIASRYNQAFLYNNDNVIIRKGTDIPVNIETVKIDQTQIKLLGTIEAPLNVEMYQLNGCCDKSTFICELKKNNMKSQKWFGESVMDCYEFEITVPMKEKMELYFVIHIGLANITTKLKINEEKLIETAKKANVQLKIVDKKKIVIKNNFK